MSGDSPGARRSFSAAEAEAVIAVVDGMRSELRGGDETQAAVDRDTRLEQDVGLDSLSRMELLARIEAATGRVLDEAAVMGAERVGDLLEALRIDDGSRARGPSRRGERGAPAAPAAGAFTGSPLDEPTLQAALKWHVEQHPERVHVHLLLEDGTVNEIAYGELHAGAARIAAGLVQRDIGAGDSVAIMLPTGRAYLESFLACVLIAAVPVPIYPPARPKQIEEHFRRHARMLANAEARALITFSQAKQLSRLLGASVPTLESLVTPEEIASDQPLILRAQSRASDTVMLQYTSGSTGDPKGVVLSHENLMSSLRSMASALDVHTDDVFVSWLPLYHDMGLIGAWIGALVAGFPLVLMSPLSFLARPERWLEAISRYRGTISGGPNFAYELCLRRIDDAALEGIDLSSWRLAFNGAEPVNASTLDAFAKRFTSIGLAPHALTPVYGLAEATLGVAFTPVGRGPRVERVSRSELFGRGRALAARDAADTLECVSSGVPIPRFEVRVVSDAGVELPDRSEGSVQFRGPGATAGYFRNPRGSATLKVGDWTVTGDRGFTLDGELFITGRDKDMLIRAGRNVYPYALEQAVGDVPGVRRGCVAVVGGRDPDSGTESLIVIAETRERDAARVDEMRRAIGELTIEHLGMPADRVLLAPPHTVLKTSSGKIRRAALAERFARGTLLASGQRAVWLQLVSLAGDSVVPWVRRMLRRLGAGAYALWCLAAAAVLLGVGVPMVLLARSRASAWARARWAARALLGIAGVQVEVRGPQPEPGRATVLIANHQSYLDAVVLVASLDTPARFVAKSELASTALLRRCLDALGVVLVNRFDRARSIASAQAVVDCLRSGDHVLFFPEGTFHRMAGLLPFQLGAFETALRAEVAVNPIVIRGTRHVLRGDDFFPRRGRVNVELLEPIAPAKVSDEQRWSAALELRAEARERILNRCAEPDLARHELRTRLQEQAPGA